MKVAFTDFWPGFIADNNFIYNLLEHNLSGVKVTHPKDAHVLFFSVFGKKHLQYDCHKVAYTGENVHADKLKPYCDNSLSFSKTTKHNKRLPLWLWYIDWFGKPTGNPNYLVPKDWLYPDRNPNFKKEKTEFCATIFSNPVPQRYEAINRLSQISAVHHYGKGGRHLPQGEQAKLQVLSNYRYNICLENSIGEGYVTEKILHAFVAGCIPIYYGSRMVKDDFLNPFLWYNDNIIDAIKAQDGKAMVDYANNPIVRPDVLYEASRAILLSINPHH